MMGLITPLTFCANGILIRTITNEKYGINFNGTNLSMSSFLVVNVFVIIIAMIYWSSHSFSMYLFWIGTFGAIINSAGLACMNTAISTGPMGPVSAIGACANIFLALVEAVKHQKVPSYIEFIALFLGFSGALELVIP